MACPPVPRFRPFVAALAALVLLTGLVLEGWTAADRGRLGARSAADLPAALALTRTRPSSAAYARLSRAQAAAGQARDAATSAVIAARLVPNDAKAAATSEQFVDAALRATVRDLLRPFAGLSVLALIVLAITGVRRRAAAWHRERTLSHARGRVVLAVEGADASCGEGHGDHAVLRPGAQALVVDAHVGAALGDLRDAPPLVVALSHAEAGRTVRLSARREYAGGAARFRVVGDALKEIARIPGRWRVLVRADGALLAEGEVRVATA